MGNSPDPSLPRSTTAKSVCLAACRFITVWMFELERATKWARSVATCSTIVAHLLSIVVLGDQRTSNDQCGARQFKINTVSHLVKFNFYSTTIKWIWTLNRLRDYINRFLLFSWIVLNTQAFYNISISTLFNCFRCIPLHIHTYMHICKYKVNEK